MKSWHKPALIGLMVGALCSGLITHHFSKCQVRSVSVGFGNGDQAKPLLNIKEQGPKKALRVSP